MVLKCIFSFFSGPLPGRRERSPETLADGALGKSAMEGERQSALVRKVVEMKLFCKFSVSFVTDFCFVKDLQLE